MYGADSLLLVQRQVNSPMTAAFEATVKHPETSFSHWTGHGDASTENQQADNSGELQIEANHLHSSAAQRNRSPKITLKPILLHGAQLFSNQVRLLPISAPPPFNNTKRLSIFVTSAQPISHADRSPPSVGMPQLENPDGSLYYGAVRNGKAHGEGTIWRSDGTMQYKGQWQDGKREGRGTSWRNDGTIEYDGQWKDDRTSDKIAGLCHE